MPISGGSNCEHPVTSMSPVEGAEGMTECLSCHAIFEDAVKNEDYPTFGGKLILPGMGEKMQDVSERTYREIESVEIVKHAATSKNGSTEVGTVSGTGFVVAASRRKLGGSEGVFIAKGDRVRLHLTNGTDIKGVYLAKKTDDGFGPWQVIFHLTDDQQREEFREWLVDLQRRRTVDFVKERARLDADFEALPDEFKERIAFFRERDPSFRAESESYEMFVCVEAVKAAEHVRPEYDRVMAGDPVAFIETHERAPVDADLEPEGAVERYVAWLVVADFDDLPYEQQRKVMSDGHSGHTHASALRMAMAYLGGQEKLVPDEAESVAG